MRSPEAVGRVPCAQASGLPAIIHLKVDPEAITPATTLGAIRKTAMSGRG
jgi:acetolactate synthase I/II/III large subunit